MGLDANIKEVDTPSGKAEKVANAREQQRTNARLGNHGSLSTLTYSTSGTSAEQLPAQSVPDGVTVGIVAQPSNSQRVWIGGSGAQVYPLSPDSRTGFAVSDTSAIYVRAESSGDGIGVIYEDG